MVTYYVALPFVRLENGGLAPGQAVDCPHSAAAIRRAEAMSHTEVNGGAIAFSRSGSPELGEFDDAVILKTFWRRAGGFRLLAVMIQRKCELSASTIDREWPHQVALPADQLLGKHHDIIDKFCRALSLCPRGHTVQRDDATYHVFCFADVSHAEQFRARFSGERFNPKDRGRGSAWFLWRKS